ncbi:potassium transporter Trk [Arenivirga flava]|uniref:Potassium transporter Trk n=1 Tax=Arenivirga flava TaxID=1930060 RepID=A0AA37XBH1_9MICO|nr:potassium transporter Trk [Arenivirga flava]GMA28753.1 hypothetical protein GCM10025874_20060 [Arenivirga flava]
MSSTEPTPETTGDTAEEVVGQEQVRVRRAPRYGVFIGLGAFLGFVAAFVLTFAFPENDEFTVGQIFGFLLLVCLVVGVALGGAAAIVIDAASSRRARAVDAERIERHGAER